MNRPERSFRGYGGANPTLWHDGVRRSFQRAANTTATEREEPDRTMQAMLGDLDNIIRYRVAVDGDIFGRFLDRLIELAASGIDQGDRPDRADFVVLLDAAVPALIAAAQPVWRMHLAKAYYYARQTNGEAARRAELRLAAATCVTARDRIEVALTSAQCAIDLTDYGDAARLLGRSLRTCSTDPTCRDQLARVHTGYGNLYYVQGSLRRALTHYQTALAIIGPENSYRTTRAGARACHYTGKILHMLGHDEEALRYLVCALKYRYPTHAEYARKSGFCHIAIAEILLNGGAHGQAEFHLAEARRTFARLRHNATAHAILDATTARLARRRGQYEEALHLLNQAVHGARDSGYRRGAVLFELHRASLLLRNDPIGAARGVFVAVRTWLGFINRGNRARAVLGGIEYTLCFLRRRRSTRARKPATTTACPCDPHTAVYRARPHRGLAGQGVRSHPAAADPRPDGEVDHAELVLGDG